MIPHSGTNARPFKIGIAGFGKMGTSMVSVWKKSNLINTIDIYDPFSSDDFCLKNEDDFIAKAPNWDILVLAIKPQTLDTFLDDAALPKDLPILSILAGKTLSDLGQKFGHGRTFIRAMPNTPASIGKGMSVAVTNSKTSESHRNIAQILLSSMGAFLWVDKEEMMDTVTALSGSGPAYLFYMVEAMAKAGEECGLLPELSMQLARQTFIGAAALTEDDISTNMKNLRENVTSPHGTTAAGLSVLMDGKFQDIVTKSIKRAAERSKELSGT